MKPLETEWKILAEIAAEELHAFHLLLPTDAALPVVCFLGQQAAEKYLKAVLGKQGISFPFSHDLLKLYYLLVGSGLTIPISPESLKKLNPFAVKQRYDRLPEIHINREEVEQIVDSIANWCKKQLV